LFGGTDPDKLVTACTYLWARDATLCDAPGTADAAFNRSRAEGQIVLPTGVTCSFAAGHIRTSDVDDLAKVTHNRHAALSDLFGRVSLRSAAPVTRSLVLAAERRAIDRNFAGSRRAYLEALTRAHATLRLARDVVRDELRRELIASGPAADAGKTMLAWTADREATAIDTAICLHDELPGDGGFPTTDSREVGVVPVLERLPFLFSDRQPPSS